MTILCHCRFISDTDLKDAFQDVKADHPDQDVTLDDLKPELGDFNCGGCKRIFERATEQFNDTGEINLFKRSRKKASEAGLCDHAQNHTYKSDGVPDLLSSPIIGEPK